MNHFHHRWLHDQIPGWEREGILTPSAAHALRERHPVEVIGIRTAQFALGGMGALLIGTGLIAVLAYNWDDFSRPVRLLWAFLPLLLAQIFSFTVVRKQEPAPWLCESAGLLQAFAAGGCLAIVSQVYHLGGVWQDFLLGWMLLSLPLAWVLRSQMVLGLYLVGICIWSLSPGTAESLWYESATLYPVLLLAVVPCCGLDYLPGCSGQRPGGSLPTFMRWILVLSASLGFCAAASHAADSAQTVSTWPSQVWMWTLTVGTILLFPLRADALAEPGRRKPQGILGACWLFTSGLAMTFSSLNKDLPKGVSGALSVPWTWGILAVFAVFAIQAARQHRWVLLSIGSLALTPLMVLPCLSLFSTPGLIAWGCTLHVFFVGVLLIGLEFFGKRGAPRLGAFLLAALVIARMSDSDFSFLTKGLAFIGTGAGFLIFNLQTVRQKAVKNPAPL